MERKFNYLADVYTEAGARSQFENICVDIVSNIHNFQGVHNIRVSRGDGGIDIFYGDIDNSVEVYQCKYFLGTLNKGRKQQIKNSFKTVKNTLGDKMKAWTLCISCDLSYDEHKWWSKFVKENNTYCSEINLNTERNLLDLMKQFNIYDKYFNVVTIDKSFFNNQNKKSRLEEINEKFSSIIGFVSETHYYVNYRDIEYIEDIINKYKGDYLFMNNNIISNLQYIVDIIYCNDGFVKGEVEKQYIETAKEILIEYNILIRELKS